MRTEYDLEMLAETGVCSGIENYSRHLDGRAPGEAPFTLLDFFPKDYLVVLDESHVAVPQLRGQYAGDRSRKETLVDHGFRLPSALDNRPLRFEEFVERTGQTIMLSATPGPWELEHSSNVVEQVMRPTGLVDPEVDVRPTTGQIDDLRERIDATVAAGNRVLVTTLTKKMAEDLTDYLAEQGVRVQYLHSDVDTIARVELLRELRLGIFDVLVGINLLREGLDLPEVALVAILDADKEGFLRSASSLIQTMGRAARNVNGRVVMYADTLTDSMTDAIGETQRRRARQIAYNEAHGIDPQTITKSVTDILERVRGDLTSTDRPGSRPTRPGPARGRGGHGGRSGGGRRRARPRARPGRRRALGTHPPARRRDAQGGRRAPLRGGLAAPRRDRRAPGLVLPRPGGRGRPSRVGCRGRRSGPTPAGEREAGAASGHRYPRPMADRLVIRGAREHNLQDVSLDLPRDRLIVFTGLSGSGKSSLAFDTIYAEGQRRYVESLSAYARQFLGQMDKPDVDFIEGLSPAISIDQKSSSRNPRSTVGTVTEVYDYLRLLYARIGKPHCPTCGRPVARQSPQQIVDRILGMEEGTRFFVLAPVVRGRKGEYGALLDDLAKQGFARVRVDGETVELTDRAALDLARYEQHTIEVVVDRLIRRDDIRRRLTESLETALSLAGGIAEIVVVDPDGTEQEAITFSQHLACTHCGLSFEDLAPRNFSFNSPYGACPVCTGLGTKFEVDPELVVPDPTKSLAEGALAPWAGCAQRVLRADARRGRRARRLLARHPVGEAPQGGQEARPLRVGHQAGPPPVPQPLRAPALLPHALRGHRAVADAPAHRGRVRLPARQPRGLPARGPVPRVRRRPPPARVTGGHRRRLLDLRPLLAVDRPGGRRGGVARPVRPRPPDRRPGLPRGPRAHAVPARRGSRLPDPGPFGGHPVRWRGAAHPAGQPDRQRTGRRALRPRRAVDRAPPAGQPAADRHLEAAARPRATRSSWSSTTRRPSGSPTTWSTSDREPASTAAGSCTRARSPARRASSRTRTR